jgi:hypothetical protein
MPFRQHHCSHTVQDVVVVCRELSSAGGLTQHVAQTAAEKHYSDKAQSEAPLLTMAAVLLSGVLLWVPAIALPPLLVPSPELLPPLALAKGLLPCGRDARGVCAGEQ